MVLNMITTTAFTSIGKVYDNFMVDVSPNSEKLIDRAARIVKEVSKCSKERAIELVKQSGNAKIAIVMELKNVSKQEAIEMLAKNGGHLKKVISQDVL